MKYIDGRHAINSYGNNGQITSFSPNLRENKAFQLNLRNNEIRFSGARLLNDILSNDSDSDDEDSSNENDESKIDNELNLSKFNVKIELGGNHVNPTFDDVSEDCKNATEKGKELEKLQNLKWDPRVNIYGK